VPQRVAALLPERAALWPAGGCWAAGGAASVPQADVVGDVGPLSASARAAMASSRAGRMPPTWHTSVKVPLPRRKAHALARRGFGRHRSRASDRVFRS